MLSRRRYLRHFPAPPPTPDDMVYARSRMRGLCLVPAHLQAQESARRMGSYDRYPRVIRDALKEGRRRPSL